MAEETGETTADEKARSENRTRLIERHGMNLGKDITIICVNLLCIYYIRSHGYADTLYYCFVAFTVFYAIGAWRAFCELGRLLRGEDLEEERQRKWREACGVTEDGSKEGQS